MKDADLWTILDGQRKRPAENPVKTTPAGESAVVIKGHGRSESSEKFIQELVGH